jgi:UDP-N-acetylmuramyl pentapeptide phosphotransferase/UDP-N-acetylglucosamine-1-phosphate transferase
LLVQKKYVWSICRTLWQNSADHRQAPHHVAFSVMTTALAWIAGAVAIGVSYACGGRFALLAAILSLVICIAGQPLFRAYAMARPNARSSHRVPVPQGGGAPVILGAALAALAAAWAGVPGGTFWLAAVGVATVMLAITGALDDIRPMPVIPRLVMQFGAVALIVFMAPATWQLFGSAVPLTVERLLLVIAGIWFVNLTNFMDGIDGITLAAFLPLAALATLMPGDAISPAGRLLATVFLGGLAGFVVFNWHPARLFLGDVGSLPIGATAGALVMDMAAHGAIAAAIIIPLYHFLDATLTLLMRLRKGERIWEAHRQHAYQKAVDAGWPQPAVSGAVLVLNSGLLLLALWSVGLSGLAQTLCVGLALAAVVSLIAVFRRAGHRS